MALTIFVVFQGVEEPVGLSFQKKIGRKCSVRVEQNENVDLCDKLYITLEDTQGPLTMTVLLD